MRLRPLARSVCWPFPGGAGWAALPSRPAAASRTTRCFRFGSSSSLRSFMRSAFYGGPFPSRPAAHPDGKGAGLKGGGRNDTCNRKAFCPLAGRRKEGGRPGASLLRRSPTAALPHGGCLVPDVACQCRSSGSFPLDRSCCGLDDALDYAVNAALVAAVQGCGCLSQRPPQACIPDPSSSTEGLCPEIWQVLSSISDPRLAWLWLISPSPQCSGFCSVPAHILRTKRLPSQIQSG